METYNIGDIVETNCNISVEKYHNGWVTFPKGSLMIVNQINCVSIILKPLNVIDIEQPNLLTSTKSEINKLPVWENGKFSL